MSWLAAGLTAGPPVGVTVIKAVVKFINCSTSPDNKVIVVSPKRRGSVAVLEPNNILLLSIIVFLVSTLKLSSVFIFTDFLAVRRIWSSLALNKSLPDDNIIWSPTKLLGVVGALV